MDICDIVNTLFHAFDQSAIPAFRAFINRHPVVSKWSIASDYSDNCFAFTIFPYNELPPKTFNYIQSKLPKDIKEIRDISESVISFFQEPNRFHIAIVVQGKPNLFIPDPDTGDTSLDVARNCIKADYTRNAGGTPDALNKIKALYLESKKKSFNLTLFSNMVMLAAFYAFISLLLSIEQKTETIGWFSDRDKMVSYCSGVIWVFSMEAFSVLSKTMEITSIPEIVIGGHTENPEPMWYDQLIRPADYLAGALANLNIPTNGPIAKKNTKQYKLLAAILPNNENIVILQFKFAKHPAIASVGQMFFLLKLTMIFTLSKDIETIPSPIDAMI